MRISHHFIYVAVLCSVTFFAGCGGAGSSSTSNLTNPDAPYVCGDGLDNDNDGLTDLDDPGCANTSDNDESNTPVITSACNDGLDNDGDGLVDLNDPGCINSDDNNEYTYQCSDGLDNDSDGLTDLNDPGCADTSDDDESDGPIIKYLVEPDEPNSTTIYAASLSRSIASPISSSIISDDTERKRWSSDVQLQAGYQEYWVAPNVPLGTGSGSSNDPWDLYSTLQKRNIIPGNSIIWMKEGDYISPLIKTFTAEDEKYYWPITIQGSTGSPIHIRPEYGAKVRVDGGFYFRWPDGANYVWIWDIEFTSLPTDSWRPKPYYLIPVEGTDVDTQFYINVAQWVIDQGEYSRSYVQIDGGDDNRVINTTIHGLGMGIGSWKRAANNVVYGNVTYDNGNASLIRLHGPGVYAQNESDTPRHFDENIVAGNLSNPFQIYSRGGAGLSGMSGKGNIIFGARQMADGTDNFNQRVDVQFGVNDGTLQNFTENYIYGHEVETSAYDATNMVFENNFVLYSKTAGCLACSHPSNIVENIPSTQHIHIRPNAYDPTRANMVVINPDRDPVVSIDLGSFASEGDYIAVFNAIDLTVNSTPVAYGIYNGGFFNLPMEGSSNPYWINHPWNGGEPDNPADSESPLNYSTAVREFWAFIIIKNP